LIFLRLSFYFAFHDRDVGTGPSLRVNASEKQTSVNSVGVTALL